MKKTILLLSCLFSFSQYVFADNLPVAQLNQKLMECPQAEATTDPGFCPSFRTVAECHCTSSGLPKSICQDIKLLYKRMIVLFGTVERACRFQHDTSVQTCIDDWSCYLNGGKDSTGGLCSSTGNACL